MRLGSVKLFVLLLSFFCCRNEERENVAARIGGTPLYLESIDSAIHEKLYERLYDIYYNRKIALEHLVTERLFQLEAVNRNLSVDSLIEIEVNNKLTESGFNHFVAEHELTKGVPDPNRIGRLLDFKHPETQSYLWEVYQRDVKREFVSQLKQKYAVDVVMKPPMPPRLNLTNVVIQPLNKSRSKIKVLMVMDSNCGACKEYYTVFREIISLFDRSVSFFYTPYSGEVSEEMLLAHCLGQNVTDFSQVFSKMFESKEATHLLQIAKGLNANLPEIERCMGDTEQMKAELSLSLSTLRNLGVTQTPSLIIDGRLYYGEVDVESLRSYLDMVVKDSSN